MAMAMATERMWSWRWRKRITLQQRVGGGAGADNRGDGEVAGDGGVAEWSTTVGRRSCRRLWRADVETLRERDSIKKGNVLKTGFLIEPVWWPNPGSTGSTGLTRFQT